MTRNFAVWFLLSVVSICDTSEMTSKQNRSNQTLVIYFVRNLILLRRDRALFWDSSPPTILEQRCHWTSSSIISKIIQKTRKNHKSVFPLSHSRRKIHTWQRAHTLVDSLFPFTIFIRYRNAAFLCVSRAWSARIKVSYDVADFVSAVHPSAVMRRRKFSSLHWR